MKILTQSFHFIQYPIYTAALLGFKAKWCACFFFWIALDFRDKDVSIRALRDKVVPLFVW